MINLDLLKNHKLLFIVIICVALIINIGYFLVLRRKEPYEGTLIKQKYEINLDPKYKSRLLDYETFLTKKTGPKNLPDLAAIDWPQYSWRLGPIISPSTKINFQNFQMHISLEEKSKIVMLLKTLFNKLHDKKLGLCMFVAGGTRLGSYRHHDIIPWDEDVDLSLDESCVKNFTIILNELQPQIKHYINYGKIKVYWGSDVPTSKYPWSWPFLDIFIFSKNDTHINEITYNNSYLKTDIYPLIYRPFGELWLPSPANILSTLINDYGATDECKSTYYSHILESGINYSTKKCEDLGEQYAFVERKLVGPIEKMESRFVWLEEILFFKNKDSTSKHKVHSIVMVGHIASVNTNVYDLIVNK